MSEEVLKLHHDKHHLAYVNGANAVLEKLETARKAGEVVARLETGEHIALVSDAGTPCISDPGSRLVARARGAGARIETVPGPSALTAALSVAGIDATEFTFLGFLPHKKGRQTLLKGIAESKYPVILYESVHRIGKLLDELPSSADIVIARELTKKFETVYRGTVEEVKKQLVEKETKGEFVVILE